jgi:hypothetical protein
MTESAIPESANPQSAAPESAAQQPSATPPSAIPESASTPSKTAAVEQPAASKPAPRRTAAAKPRAKTNGTARKPAAASARSTASARANGAKAKEAAKPSARQAPATPVQKRLARLRDLAKTNPARAQSETWAWIKELGKSRDDDGLTELFSLGTPPKGLDGPTDGILVTTFINPLVDLPVRLLTGGWMPWMGKSFDAASNKGTNRLTGSARWPAKLLWPLYRTREAPDGRLAFDFETAVEKGRTEPAVRVLKIDYEPVETNPRLVIRQIRDELVELVPDTYLGRILFKVRGGRYANIGYFALRQHAG